jgi:hypothetical protein
LKTGCQTSVRRLCSITDFHQQGRLDRDAQ